MMSSSCTLPIIENKWHQSKTWLPAHHRTALHLDAILLDGLDGIPLGLYVGPMQRSEVSGIDDDSRQQFIA